MLDVGPNWGSTARPQLSRAKLVGGRSKAVWRGGGGASWSHGSSEFVYEHTNGTLEFDEAAIAAVKPFM